MAFDNPALLATAARIEILRMTHAAKASHVGSSLSVVDLLSTLYAGGANIRPTNLRNDERDIVLLSKGHGAAALYAVLALQEFFPVDWLSRYCADDSPIGGHVTSTRVPGAELSTGSLGHGLPYGIGIALARKRSNLGGHIYVILSDGECDEGTTWESALIANQFQLNNLTAIIDRNRIQSLGPTEKTLQLEPFASKWEAFGWESYSGNGHSHSEIAEILQTEPAGPRVVIAETIKGFGVSFMENANLWHYKWPNDEELRSALSEVVKKNA